MTIPTPAHHQETVAELGTRFWAWRSGQQPRSSDDIPRLERPRSWLPLWSAADVAGYREQVTAFESVWAGIPVPRRGGDRGARAALVDHALIGSAIARVRFELDVVSLWSTHPGFYVDQSIGVVFEHLLALPGFDEERAEAIAVSFQHVPTALAWGRQNLAETMVRDFALTTVASLAGVEQKVATSVEALVPLLPQSHRQRVASAAGVAAHELGAYRDWVAERAESSDPWEPIGTDLVGTFLREIALNPIPAEEQFTIGWRELARAEALSAIEALGTPAEPAPLLADIAAQVERERTEEIAVRSFYEQRDILSQPASLGHYLVAAMPAYLAPLTWLGVTDDLTSDSRVDEDGVSYMPDPREGLPYFYDANARDPRAGIIHEGAHYQQLALSWRHPNPLRRRYYDSGPNEGIAFYNEELMLRSGLFADAPGTRSVVHSFLRLRALRVLVDLGLATGKQTIRGAGRLMAERVPMDLETATDEAAFFAAIPVQGSTYQIGKTQIEAFLADARRVQGDSFSLRDFHDSLWLEGNVPIALQRYELLGLDDELDGIRL